MVGNWASLEKSWVRAEVSVPLKSKSKEEPEVQRKPEFSHVAFPKAELFCEQRTAEARDKLGAARLAHQTPKVKKKRRLNPVNFLILASLT